MSAIFDVQVGGIFTFGQPRTGDAAFSRAMERLYPGKAHRIVHAADIIPHVRTDSKVPSLGFRVSG